MILDSNITLCLNLAKDGDRRAENHVIQLVYDKLRLIAGSLLRGERAGHTLQPTALVSELFVRKLRAIQTPIQNREHFYSLAACAMRQVLVDYGRSSRAGRRRLTPEAVAELLTLGKDRNANAEDRLAVQQVFRALSAIDKGAARSVQCRFVAGLTIRQSAAHLNKPEWKVRADCDFALTWMAERLGGSR